MSFFNSESIKAKKYLVILVVFQLFEILCYNAYTQSTITKEEEQNMKTLIQQLESKDPQEADKAAMEIFKKGEIIFPFLIDNASNNSLFYGKSLYHPYTSLLLEEITVGTASLFLAEAIIRGEFHFALNPLLAWKGEKFPEKSAEEPKLKLAIRKYREWLKRLKRSSLEKMREKKDFPLKGTNLEWDGEIAWDNMDNEFRSKMRKKLEEMQKWRDGMK